jgi:lipopolysaccharide export system protein LptA
MDKIRSGLLLAAVAVLSGSIVSRSEVTNGTVITSDLLELDYRRSMAVFEHNVVVQDQQIRIEADKIVVIFDDDRTIKSVTATGEVVIYNEDRKAECERAVYLARSGEVVLTGNDARVSRGMDSVEGKRITFWIDDERVICEPGRLIVFPARDDARSRIPAVKKREGTE